MRSHASIAARLFLRRTVAGNIVMTVRASVNGHEIRHVKHSGQNTIYDSLASTGKESTGQTERTITSCLVWEERRYLMTERNSPLGVFCRSCGSAIPTIRKRAMLGSFSDTISSNGRNYFPSDRLIYSSLMPVLKSVPLRWYYGRICFLIPLFGIPGKSTLWRGGDSSYVHTLIDAVNTLLFVETALALSAWKIRTGSILTTLVNLYRAK